MSKTLGIALRNARERLVLTQSDVAGHLSVSKAAVGQWERGVTEPSTMNLLRVCELLKLDVTSASGGLVHLVETPPVVGPADDDDRAYSVEDRRPIAENKATLDGLSRFEINKSTVPILQVAPVPFGLSVHTTLGVELQSSLVMWWEVVDTCSRPPGITEDQEVISFYTPHNRLSPRYKLGELTFFVKQGDARVGDFVLLEYGAPLLEPPYGSLAVFGKLIKKLPEKLVVEEADPPRDYVVERDACEAIYRALLVHELFGK